MGFGLLFAGWITLLFFKIVPIGLAGCEVMRRGLCKLSAYGEKFERAKKACVVLEIYFGIFAVLWIMNIFGIFRFTTVTAVVYADEILYYAALLYFSHCLYTALEEICRETGFEKGVVKSRKCNSLLIVFVIFTAIRFVSSFFGLEGYLVLPLFVYELFWLCYSGTYIYSCYMMISTQEIIDEEERKIKEYDEKYSMIKIKKKR